MGLAAGCIGDRRCWWCGRTGRIACSTPNYPAMPSMRTGRAIGSSQAFGDPSVDSWPSDPRRFFMFCCYPNERNSSAGATCQKYRLATAACQAMTVKDAFGR